MAAVVDERPDPVARFGSQVAGQIAQATSRIRVHDFTLGVLILSAMAAVYATAIMLLDRYLNLAEWVRQLALGGFITASGVVGYFLIARPLLKRINPLYAAARVEETIDDPKNSVTGYVEAQESGNVHAAVKAAMSARAAKAVGEADVNQAVNHRSLVVVGGVLIAFLLILGVLFFVFRPTQFNSLAGRAFFPFSSSPIATRTQIALVKPEPPEPTITTGQTITVAVQVGGKVPAKAAPDHVRVLVRHNPADPTYEAIPLSEGETRRDWSVRIPEYLVQNGFWYKVAAGDAETPEYKVTVRSLPLFTDFEARYQYPKYTRKPNDKANDPNVRGVRGTKVSLEARTNRQVKAGLMKFEAPGIAPVAGKPVTGKPDALLFQFIITEPTRYRLTMTTVDDEQNTDAPPYLVLVDADQPPRVEITRPEEPEATAPANGQLAVDGTVGDDFGIDKIRLRMRVAGRDLTPVFYNGGMTLRREKDNTWPTDLTASGGFKLSADLTKLRFADTGAQYQPKEDDTIEFWVEAIDNCTETKAVEGWGDKPQPGNVGSSLPPRKLKLTPPKTSEDDKKQLDQQKDARKADEQQHNAAQQQHLNDETREPPKPDPTKQQDTPPQPKEGDSKPQDGTDQPKGVNAGKTDTTDKQEPKEGKKDGENTTGTGGMSPDNPPKKPEPEKKGDPASKGGAGGATDPKSEPRTDAKTEPKSDPTMMPPGGMPPAKKNGDGKASGMPPTKGDRHETGMGMGGGMNPQPMPTAPQPRSEEDRKFDDQLKQAEEELKKLKGDGGDAKPNATPRPEERTEPAQPKPQPMGGAGQDAQPKPGPQSPMGDQKNAAAQPKPEGNLGPPPNPDPESKSGPKGDMETPPKPEPLGGSAGRDKDPPQPKKDANPNDPDRKNQDPGSGATGKAATDRNEDPTAGPNEQPKDPAASAGAPKPNPVNDRGTDKTPPQPQGMRPADGQPKVDPSAAAAKPDKAPPAAGTKPMPKDGTATKQPDASQTKDPTKNPNDPQNATAGASETKPDMPKPMSGGTADDKRVERGIDKDAHKDQAQAAGATPQDKKESGKAPAAGKLDEEQLQAIKDAAKDLNDPDPNKQQAAREKLDKAVGKSNREAIEDFQKQQKEDLDKLAKDLQSKDEATREAAQQKLKDLQQRANQIVKKEEAKGGKGRELSDAELKELTDNLRDLASGDEGKRREAEKKLDDRLGKGERERIQKEMEKRREEFEKLDPEQQRELLEKLKEQVRNDSKGGEGPVTKTGGGQENTPPAPPAESDPRNKAKAAQLQLDDFKNQRFGAVPEALKWDDDTYKKFLDDLEKRARKLEEEADKYEEAMRNTPPKPTIDVAGAGKVDERANVVGPGGIKAAAGYAPPGFEKPRDAFQKALQKLDLKK